MNLRHPKVIRLGGWGAGITTLLAVAAGTYLAVTFLQAGNLLEGGIVAGMTVASGLFGGLFSYCLYVFAGMQRAAVPAPVVTSPADPEVTADTLEVNDTPAD